MSKTKIISPKARVAFANLLTPRSYDGGEAKYSCTLIFDPAAQASPEFKKMKEALTAAVKEKWSGKVPANLRSPFLTPDEADQWGFPEDCVFIRVSSKMKPQVIDQAGQEIIDSADVYSGMFGRASLTIYTYERSGNKGVAFGLNNFQKLGDGEAMGSRTRAVDDFGISAEDANADVDAMFGG